MVSPKHSRGGKDRSLVEPRARGSAAWVKLSVVWVLGVCIGVAIAELWRMSRVDSSALKDDAKFLECEKRSVRLFIAIGSKPSNMDLRDSAREGWLRWAIGNEDKVAFKFFTDAPDFQAEEDSDVDIVAEEQENLDMVLMPIEGGYGTKENNNFLARALFQLTYAKERYDFDYLLRIDDDSFLCLHRLLFELGSYPSEQFFMGRFWCKSGRHRADENFMLMSSDVVAFLASASPLVPLDPQVTFAWNFGLLLYTMNITTFDDQTRIDAQQGYLTEYMHQDSVNEAHTDDYANFCQRLRYSLSTLP